MVTADVKGEITFSVPAEELDCATLVVQAHDFDGNPTGSAFTVTPDTDVRGFLGGTGTLTDQGSPDVHQPAGRDQHTAAPPSCSPA